MEACPAVLFDALIVPDGVAEVLGKNGLAIEYVKEQYRHCKPLLALGDARGLLDAAGVPTALPSGDPDPGCLRVSADDLQRGLAAFITALEGHRQYERETDPPRV
jgi:catalase